MAQTVTGAALFLFLELQILCYVSVVLVLMSVYYEVTSQISEKRKVVDVKDVKPPLVEVGCGIAFPTVGIISAKTIFALMGQFSGKGYTEIEEHPPVLLCIEENEQTTQMPPQTFQNRTWFVNPSDNSLIQLQPDRFLRNWRRGTGAEHYPGFETVLSEFESTFCDFRTKMADCNLPIQAPLQYELTYVNHLLRGHHWETLSDLSKVFPFLQKLGDGHEDNLEGFAVGITQKASQLGGRLHFQGVSAISRLDGSNLMQITFVARGLGEYNSYDKLGTWFMEARSAINRLWMNTMDKDLQEISGATK